MKPRAIADRVLALGAVDWDRRLFDSLIPLPDGTSYNAYVVQGSEKTVLLDAVDPSKREVLLDQLDGLPPIDLVVSHHAEQDHSGVLPDVPRALSRRKARRLHQGERNAARPPGAFGRARGHRRGR